MRLKGTKPEGVKIAIQPYPYVKGKSKGQNKSLLVLEASTDEVYEFIEKCFQQYSDDTPDDN
jgi:hypothetical protein